MSAPHLLVGVDVGTTSTKAAVVDVSGRVRAQGTASTPWRQVPTGAEMDAQVLLRAVGTAVQDALADIEGTVVAVGVASMAETGVLLDADGRPLTPAVAWHDRRGEDDAVAMEDRLGAEAVARHTGLKIGAKLTAATYRRLARTAPVGRGRRWLSVAEWIVHALGGDAVAEASLASRTGWLDLGRRDWWPDAVAFSGIEAHALPPIRQAGEVWGWVTDRDPSSHGDGPIHTGRLHGALLTVAGHDHQAAAIGAGAIRDGDVLDSCGTAEAVLRTVAPLDGDGRRQVVDAGLSVGWAVVPGRMAIIGGFPSGDRLGRLLDLLGEDRRSLDERAARSSGPDGSPPLTLADLDELVGAAGGDTIAQSRNPEGLWRAATEAIASHGVDVLARMEEIAGPWERVVIVGGWCREGALLRAKEELVGPLVRPPVTEPGARGAALLAGVAAGLYPGAVTVPLPEATFDGEDPEGSDPQKGNR